MFLQNVRIAAEQVAILYIIAVIGLICDKAGIYTESTAKKCTDLLFYVITPAKILQSFFDLEYSPDAVKGLFLAIGCGLLMHGVAALFVTPLYRKSPPEKASVYKFASMYGNCGYMGLPLVDAVLGSEGVFFCSAVIVSFQIFNFTHGVFIMNAGKTENKAKIEPKRLILNPGVLPVLVGLPLFILSVKLPNILDAPVRSLANLNSPLAMLIFGTYISNTNFKSIFKEWRIFTVGLFKLIAMPLAMLAAVKFTGLAGTLGMTLLITSATPSANNTVMFSAKYDRNTGLASQTVAVLSLISIVTLPVMIALGKM